MTQGYKAVFVHSHKFIYDSENIVYSKGQFPYSTWKRYLKHFENLVVIGRFEYSEKISSYNISSGKNIKHIKVPNISVIKGRIKKNNETKKILLEEIKKCDIVIVRLPSVYGILAVDIAKKMQKPYVIELVGHVFSSLWFHGSILGKILAPFSYLRLKAKVRKAPYILYVTQEFLQKKYPSKILKITTACSNVEIDASNVIYDNLKPSNDVFSIGLIGSYSSKYKGIENALNVIKRLNVEGLKIEFRILGSGNKDLILNKTKELGIENIVYLDGMRTAGIEVMKWLRQLDLYIQPSLTEGLPRSLVEAMYSELPCVASSVGGIPELLSESVLHRPKDEIEMYEKIKKMYLNEDYRLAQARLNKKKAENYTKEKLDGKRKIFWEQILNEIGRVN